MIDLTSLQKEKELGECLARLKGNKDFQMLIEQEYLKDFPAQLAMLLGSDEMQYPETQVRIKKSIDGIGSFSNFLNRIRIAAESAKQSIDAVDSGEVIDFDDVAE